MKKLFIAIGIFCFATNANAQEPTKGRLGLMVSPSLTWLSPETNGIEKDRNTLGISYGLIGDIKILNSQNYYFSTGIGFTQYGGALTQVDRNEINSVFVEGNSVNRYRFNQVDIPLSLKMVSGEIGYVSLYAQFGMSLGFITKASKDQEFISSASNIRLDREDLDVLNSEAHAIRASLLFGGGVEYNMVGNMKWFIGGQFSNGITNALKGNYFLLDNNNDIQYETDGTARKGPKNRAVANIVSLNLGLIF